MPTNRFAAVQLTLLSVIVALILENLLNQLGSPDSNWDTALPWLQSALVSVTVITIWSGFALILSISARTPEAVDFIHPFVMLIALTLAANSLGTFEVAEFFAFLALGGIISMWALNAEFSYLRKQGGNQTAGIRRAIYIQAAGAALESLMALVLFIATPPAAVLIFALIIAIAIQIVAAMGTMTGWRFVAQAEQS